MEEVSYNEKSSLRGINAILARIQQPEFIHSVPAMKVLHTLLTIDNHIPLVWSIESLTHVERYILEIVNENPDLVIEMIDLNDNLPKNACIVLQERRVGHVSILLPEELGTYSMAEDCFLIGALFLSQDDLIRIQDYNRMYRAHFERQHEQIVPQLHLMEQTGELKQVIHSIREALLHMAPVAVYVWHNLYSTFDQAGKNLVDLQQKENGTRILSVIQHQPLATWSIEDCLFIYGMYILLQSGGPYRLEEMNGSQITPETLQDFFDKKATLYRKLLGLASPPEWQSQCLLEKSRWLAVQCSHLSRSFLRYRRIHGMNLRKEEHFTTRRQSSPEALPSCPVRQKIQRIFGIAPLLGETRQCYWERVTRDVLTLQNDVEAQCLNSDQSGTRVFPFAFLLWLIVQTAVEVTHSDIGMSSFIRDVASFSTSHPLSLEKPDFFCCTVPSPAIVEKYQDDALLSEILRMISARMQFNRWHFIPGTTSYEEISAKRNWFYAPTAPDIATWSDQHHSGHIEAVVRHTVRYPAPLTLFGKEYAGAYDIRLMRQDGPPYTEREMLQCGEFVSDMGRVLHTLIEYIGQQNRPVVINEFDTSWYKAQIWKKWLHLSLL